MADVEEGGGMSEGELEDGEVLSSEDEGDGEEEERKEEGDKENSGDNFDNNDNDSQKIGTKRPAQDTDAPEPKAVKLQSPSGPPQSLGTSNSDAEEGEIFSDDEEAAYFPQRIKSRKTTTAIDHDASESDDKKNTVSRRDRDSSYSPERDSVSSRHRKSKDREKDGEPKSLASLFFEDRDGTPSELSDDAKMDGGYSSKKGGERYSHSDSPSRSHRDRERSGRDHDKKEKSYYRSKNTYRGRERDWDRDQDSNVDSSEEESSWSQRGPRNKGYTSSYQRGSRRGGSGKYQSKYGQKHDRFGTSSSGDGRGRQGNTSWGHSSGRINTGMTAQEFYAQAENVRKRREKGLSLLTTPNIKPSDNLDQFNYPAPPSWYIEAIENWDKMKQQNEVGGSGGDAENSVTAQPQPTTNPVPLIQGQSTVMAVPEQPKPQPLFPPSTQFTPPLPTTELNSSILGNPPQSFQPLMPSQIPLPPTQLIPPVTQVQVPSLFPLPPNEMPIAVNPTLLNMAVPQPPPITSVSGQPHGATQLAVVGIASDDNKSSTSTVRVSSLVLDVSSTVTKAHEVGSPDDDEEEGGMKIALETPTPQLSATGVKSFPLFQTTSSEKLVKEEELISKDVPVVTKDNDVEMAETDPTKMKPEVVCTKEKEEKDVTPSLNDQTTTTTPPEAMISKIPVSHEPTSALEGSSAPTATETSAVESSSDPTELKTYSPPPMVPTPSLAPTIPTFDIKPSKPSFKAEVEVSGDVHMDSEPEEEDSDYDKYLDQLDEEEDEEEMPKSSLVGVISASLLQNNPLDEDFPAIDPANESSGRNVSLKSLLAEEEGIIVERSSSAGSKNKGSKSARRRRKETEWWNRHNNDTRTVSPTIKPLCKYYLNGFCKQGDECQYSHDCPRPKKRERCKFYLQDSCTKGEDCLYIHGDYPCKFFHTNTGCKHGEQCKFSHSPLTDETRELLEQVLEPSRKRSESVAMGTGSETTPLATSPVVLNHEQQKVVDSQVRVPFYTAGTVAESPQQEFSPLLISIPKQVLDPKSLTVSIPRQKLGPPFGTVPINAPSLAPSSQASIVTSSLSQPPISVPQTTTLPSIASQTSQAVTFQPSMPPPNVPPPPIQSLPPTNFPPGPPRAFPMPPRPNLPPTNMPPPPSGWQVVTNQPVPLFPPIGGQQNAQVPPGLPQCPPGQAPPQVAPQFHVPPSDRKGLLPTPPSHLKIDPKNIQWPEESDKPEYWEVSGGIRQSGPFPMATGHPPPGPPPAFGNQLPGVPPASGLFVTQPPPPPHGPPQAAALDTVPQQPPPPFNQQQGIQTRMDPRQSRVESRSGGSSSNIDPRSMGSGSPNIPIGSNDPRHGGPPGITVLLQQQTSFQPPPMPQVPMQNFPQGPPTAQWPQHPPPQRLSAPHGPIPMPSTGMASGIGGTPNQLHEFRPPPNFTNHPPPFQQPPPPHLSQPPSTLWAPNPPLTSTAAVTSIASANTNTVGQRDGGTVAAGEVRPPPSSRIDPRTKYSHLKIKPKGSPSSSGSPSTILKGRSGTEEGTGTGERTQMPKLLQEPPSLQQPFDPRELFDSAASKDETSSKSQVLGPFGSTFGSFFARSSSSESATAASDALQYGEITMNKDNNSTSTETNKSTAESVGLQENLTEKDELRKATVPSYLAELGVGESDLTIDSAFSSLDQRTKEDGEDNKAVTAKKLPNIFGLASGPL